MAEYLANAVQNVGLNQPAIFTASIPCNRGYIYHEDETGIFTLRGIVNNPNCCFARYEAEFTGNIAIPEEGTAGPIAMAITVNGEARPTSRSIYTPAEVDEYGNVTSIATITVPKGCCFTLSVRSVSAVTDDPTAEPAPVILLQNANLRIKRVA